MEKSELTAYENRCIQEEPAYCTAACPLHVDVKSFMAHMAARDMDKAFNILEKTLPLPDVLARVCDRPCEPSCIRNTLDEPLAVGDLERACAGSRTRRKKRFSLPPRDKKIGIWGSGLSSLTAAWDLALKGYGVSVFDANAAHGGFLDRIDRKTLPLPVLEREIGLLKSFGVEFHLHAGFDDLFDPAGIPLFHAVFLGFDTPSDTCGVIAYDGNGQPKADPFSLETGLPLVFAGGFSLQGETVTPVDYPVAFAAQGRKAAVSMDRALSRVSMTAGREKEGPFATRLSTDIRSLSAQARVAAPETGYDAETAAAEARRCIQCDCSRCIRACAYIESFKGFPGRYAREIYNNNAIVMGERKANRLINSCTLCGLCETVCPNDFSMADLCLGARQHMVRAGKMPVPAHEFALQEMAFAAGDGCFLARHEPGADRSDRIFFPGCQLQGSAPGQAARVYAFLRRCLPGRTGLVTGCCGAPAWWAGQEELFRDNLTRLTAFWEASGKPRIITACTACTRMLEQGIRDIRTTSLYQILWEVREQLPEPDRDARQAPGQVSIIDPCTARDDRMVQQAVRNLAASAGLALEELPASGQHADCCGFGGLVFNANPPLAKEIARRRAGQSTGNCLAYCAMCRDRLANRGKSAAHLLDLYWPETDSPWQRDDPGFSGRRKNLAASTGLLRGLWGDTAPEPLQDLPGLILSARVSRVLEEQFILTSDIQKVLARFETHGITFSNPQKASLVTGFRPLNVWFWVEFRETPDGFQVLDAWCHRMDIQADTTFIPGIPDPKPTEELRCKPCGRPLEFYKNHLEYLGNRFDVALPQCRSCGAVFIPRELARGKMTEVEQILEDK